MIAKVLILFLVEIIFKTASKANIDLRTALPLSRGIQISGNATNDQIGYSVGSAGDFNDDGLDDIIVGAPFADPFDKASAGIVYVIYGKAGGFPSDIDLNTNLPFSEGFRILGAVAGDNMGYFVSYAKDVNKDGISDIIIGAPCFDLSGRSNAGAAYVIYGVRGGMTADIDLTSGLPLSQGFTILGEKTEDRFGCYVSFAGDVNNDKVNDVIIGAFKATASSPSRVQAGAVYVIYGRDGGYLTNIDLSTPLSLSQGLRIIGNTAYDQLGYGATSAGDFNGDGIGDIILGAPRFNPTGRTEPGKAYVIYGQNGGFSAHIDLITPLTLIQGLEITGSSGYDRFGYYLNFAKDLNNDGIDDVMVGGKNADPLGRNDAGTVFVIYGKKGGFSAHIDLSIDLTLDKGLQIYGGADLDRLGNPMSFAGDINHDGVSDLILGAYYSNPFGMATSGTVYLIYGKEGGFPAHIDLSVSDLTQGFQITGAVAGDSTGYSVSFAGDLNNDGVDDMLFSAPSADPFSRINAGVVYVIYSPFCFTGNCIECSGKVCLKCAEGYFLNPWDEKCYTKESCPSGIWLNLTKCVVICDTGYILNPWDEKCYSKESCPSETWLTATQCLEESTKTLEVIQGSATQAAGLAASSVSAINFMNPGGFLFAALADLLQYMKHMSIMFPPKLQYLLDQPQPELFSIEYISSAPSEVEDLIAKYKLPENFEKYEIPSSFLINFWSSLATIMIIALLIVIVCLITYLTRNYRVLNAKLVKLKEALKWNFLLGNFIGSFGPIAFYSSFEMRTVQFESILDTISFLVCVLVNVAVIFVFFRITLILKKICSQKDSSKYEEIKEKFKDYEIAFDSYKNGSLLQQSCFLISCFRLYFFYLVLGYLFEYPLVQAILINLQGLAFLFYLLYQRPFKEKLDLFQSVILEFILELIHISVLGLAIIDQTGHTITDSSVVFGEIIIICNSVFLIVGFIYLFIEFVSMIITLIKIIKEKVNGSATRPKIQIVPPRLNVPKSSPEIDVSDLSIMNETHDLIMSHQVPNLSKLEDNIDNRFERFRKKVLSQNSNPPATQTISIISKQTALVSPSENESVDLSLMNATHELFSPSRSTYNEKIETVKIFPPNATGNYSKDLTITKINEDSKPQYKFNDRLEILRRKLLASQAVKERKESKVLYSSGNGSLKP